METQMQARNCQIQVLSPMESTEIRNAGRPSIRALVRHWGPYLLTALVVPGGIVIALVLLLNRWNQRRQAVQSPAGA
jgi:hypothetical protein